MAFYLLVYWLFTPIFGDDAFQLLENTIQITVYGEKSFKHSLFRLMQSTKVQSFDSVDFLDFFDNIRGPLI